MALNFLNKVSKRIQFSLVAQSCPNLCDPMDCSTPGLPVHHQLPESTQTHVPWVGDAIQPSHPVIPFSACPQSFPASGSFSNVSTVKKANDIFSIIIKIILILYTFWEDMLRIFKWLP